eukprot:1160112-Pelagomonas_calceolata.AAC.4
MPNKGCHKRSEEKGSKEAGHGLGRGIQRAATVGKGPGPSNDSGPAVHRSYLPAQWHIQHGISSPGGARLNKAFEHDLK